jgi:gas vesicle protein
MDDREFAQHYSEMHESKAGGFLAGVLIGALAGAAAMLLWAPRAGEETRHILRDKSMELREQVSETADEARHRAEDVMDSVRKGARRMTEGSQEMLEEQKSRVSSAVEAGRKKMRRG